MLQESSQELQRLGAQITTQEIKQQPELWQEVLETYQGKADQVQAYLDRLSEAHDSIRVIFTGAGTSAYVGESIIPYLNSKLNHKQWDISPVATTDLVSNPTSFFAKEVPTLLVSFARSGNSPESVAAVQLGQDLVQDFYQMTITCNAEGELAKAAQGDPDNLVLLQPERSNDRGLAMTGSFSCMVLTALLAFDPSDLEEKLAWAKEAIAMGEEVIDRVAELEAYSRLDYHRVTYVGSGGFLGLGHETRLKMLELTAGRVATDYESSLGFRHGPKSFIDDRTLVFVYLSNDDYTRAYDVDIVKELTTEDIAESVITIQVDHDKADLNVPSEAFTFDQKYAGVPDGYLVLPFVMVGQTMALMTSVKVGLEPDDPSPSGTINRVVEGVTIYPYEGE